MRERYSATTSTRSRPRARARRCQAPANRPAASSSKGRPCPQLRDPRTWYSMALARYNTPIAADLFFCRDPETEAELRALLAGTFRWISGPGCSGRKHCTRPERGDEGCPGRPQLAIRRGSGSPYYLRPAVVATGVPQPRPRRLALVWADRRGNAARPGIAQDESRPPVTWLLTAGVVGVTPAPRPARAEGSPHTRPRPTRPDEDPATHIPRGGSPNARPRRRPIRQALHRAGRGRGPASPNARAPGCHFKVTPGPLLDWFHKPAMNDALREELREAGLPAALPARRGRRVGPARQEEPHPAAPRRHSDHRQGPAREEPGPNASPGAERCGDTCSWGRVHQPWDEARPVQGSPDRASW